MAVYLITGGAGSLGKELVKVIQARDPASTIRVIDINEAELAMLKHPVRRIYGNICDRDRIDFAMRGVDVCIHAAALKNLEIAEYNIDALLETNIQGTLSVARAAMKYKVKHAIFISSDKAVLPTTAYGASKQMGERIWLWAHRIQRYTNFIIFRSGNFCESRGNVFEVWKGQAERGELFTVTSPQMKRMFIKTAKAAETILNLLNTAGSGDIIVPRMKEYKIWDLLEKMYPGARKTRIPSRPGEKMKEEIISPSEKVTWENPDFQVVRGR